MSQPHSYKDRTVEVRNSARAHLKNLRQQRINNRKSAVLSARSGQGFDSFEGGRPEEHAKDAASCAEDNTAPVFKSANSDGEQDAPTVVPTDSSEDDLHDLAVENVAMSEMVEDVTSAQESSLDVPRADEEQSTDLNAPEDAQTQEDDNAHSNCASEQAAVFDEPDVEEDLVASDLGSLPGAGPGLVWMLKQCGVHSLGDLARKSPEQLTGELGVVGQILDVSQWIEFARNASD